MHRVADERWSALLQTNKSVIWSEAKAYLPARVAVKKVPRLKSRSIAVE